MAFPYNAALEVDVASEKYYDIANIKVISQTCGDYITLWSSSKMSYQKGLNIINKIKMSSQHSIQMYLKH